MGSNKDSFALFNLWDDFLIPERQSPGNGVLQALTCWQLVLCQVSIATILGERPRSHSCPVPPIPCGKMVARFCPSPKFT